MVMHARARLGSVQRGHILRHQSLLVSYNLVENLFPIVERAKASALNGCEMDKDIHAFFGTNEAVALVGIKPMNFP